VDGRRSGPLALYVGRVWPYYSYMINQQTNSNPYRQQMLEKSYSIGETYYPSRQKRTFPLTIAGFTFETEKEYNDAIADFLNGN